jgi:hypothetical protein
MKMDLFFLIKLKKYQEDIEKDNNILLKDYSKLSKKDKTLYDFTNNEIISIQKPLNPDDKNCTVGIYYYICNNDKLDKSINVAIINVVFNII